MKLSFHALYIKNFLSESHSNRGQAGITKKLRGGQQQQGNARGRARNRGQRNNNNNQQGQQNQQRRGRSRTRRGGNNSRGNTMR